MKIRFVVLGIVVLVIAGLIVYTQVITGSESLSGRPGMLYFYSDT